MNTKKPELLSPAGNLEGLKVAFAYGADAVYLSGSKYGLRARADNFTPEQMKEGVDFAHSLNKRVYVTLNIIPHNDDLNGLDDYVRELEKLEVDGVIVSDPGIMLIVKEAAPAMRIHLSTQANNTNYKSAEFWYKNVGVKRITLARELSLKEITDIVDKTPDELEFEVFVHGAICISYSGRCMLSSYMIKRDANKGDCAHPCRWQYTLEEEKRKGEHQPVYEDDRGTYVFNSKDLCLIEYIPDLIKAGISSFKIEGRMKSSYYVAVVTQAYRQAIDSFPEVDPQFLSELNKINNRGYTTGFLIEKPNQNDYVHDSSGYTYPYTYIGLVLSYDENTKTALVRLQNKLTKGDEVEVMGPGRSYFTQTIDDLADEDNNPIPSAPHPRQIAKIKLQSTVKPLDIIRKKNYRQSAAD